MQQYLTFGIDQEIYGLPINFVREIIRVNEITRVPRAPTYVEGVMNLRGKIIPVTNLRLRFGVDRAQFTKHTCIIIIEGSANDVLGVVVDRVKEVLSLSENDIEPPPQLGRSQLEGFVTGLGKTPNGVLILLSPQTLVDSDKLEHEESSNAA